MLLCGWISMSAGSFFALFEQAGSDAVLSWPLNQLTNFRVGIQPFLRRCSSLRRGRGFRWRICARPGRGSSCRSLLLLIGHELLEGLHLHAAA